MELGIHIADFTWPGGPATCATTSPGSPGARRTPASTSCQRDGPRLADRPPRAAGARDARGLHDARLPRRGTTEQVELLTWVTAVVYREPGLLAKLVTTLDVLSGGRAWLGIGAAWNEEESRGLGLPFPPTAERFERLEETLQICLQMWSDDDEPVRGQALPARRAPSTRRSRCSRPHPPILIGGGGEKKTLRLVAQYAEPATCSPRPELAHKLDVLREHCERVGRDYDDDREDGDVPRRPRTGRRERRRDPGAPPTTSPTWASPTSTAAGWTARAATGSEVLGERVIPEISRYPRHPMEQRQAASAREALHLLGVVVERVQHEQVGPASRIRCSTSATS